MEFSSWALFYPWSNLIGIVFVSWVTRYLLPQLYSAWSLFFICLHVKTATTVSWRKREDEIFLWTLREILLKPSIYEDVSSLFQVCLTIWQHLQLLSESHHAQNFEGIALSSRCEWCCQAFQGHCISWCFFMLSDFFLFWKPLDLFFSFLFEIAFWCDLGHLSFIILGT